jgi:hypothetical protein
MDLPANPAAHCPYADSDLERIRQLLSLCRSPEADLGVVAEADLFHKFNISIPEAVILTEACPIIRDAPLR